MVRLSGVEPPTSGATNLRSNQLSYNRTSSASAPRGLTYGVFFPFASPSIIFAKKGEESKRVFDVRGGHRAKWWMATMRL